MGEVISYFFLDKIEREHRFRRKIKAVSPDLENYGLSNYLTPTRKASLADCFANNPMTVLIRLRRTITFNFTLFSFDRY